MPQLSIIIVAFNHEKFVGELVESVLSQTFKDFELIAVDDGSQDRTPEILASYGSRIKLIRQENQGVVAGRMRGFRESTGEYVCFVDSDDKLVPTRFEQQLEILENNPQVGLVYGDAYIMDESGEVTGRFSEMYRPYAREVARNLFCKYCFIPAITVTFRRSVFEHTGPLWGPGPVCDYLKWIEMALVSEVSYIPEPLGYWRRHSASVSFSADRERGYLEMLDALKKLREKHEQLRMSTRLCAARRYGRIYCIIGFFRAQARDFRKARRYFLAALRQFPAGLENWLFLLLSLPPLSLFSGTLFDWIYTRVYKWR